MRITTLRLIAAAVAYATGVLLAAQTGTAALDTIAAAATSIWHAIGGALSTAVVAVIGMASSVELLTAVLAPLAFLAMATIFGLIVGPAIVDHVPNTDPDSAAAPDAEVLTLPARRRSSAGREAA